MPRSRNVRLTPVQRDVLWAVEEAGEEDLWTVWITVQHAHGRMPKDQFRVEFVDGLFGLSRLGYVRMVYGSRRASEPVIEVPHAELERIWVGEMQDVADGLAVEMTDAGYKALGEPRGALPS